MFCFRVKKHLIPYMEETLDRKRADAVARHLAKCTRCREELELIRRASGALRSAKTPAQEPAADLWSRIEREISPMPAPAVRNLHLRTLQLGGAALGAAVILFTALNIGRVGEKPAVKMAQRTVVAATPNIESKKELDSTKSNRPVITDARQKIDKKDHIAPQKYAEQTTHRKDAAGRPGATLMASVPAGVESVLADPGAARSTSDSGSAFYSLNRSYKSSADPEVQPASPSAVNAENYSAQNFEPSKSLNEGQATGAAQNPENLAKIGQDTAEVAAAPAQQNNISSVRFGNADKDKKNLNGRANEVSQSQKPGLENQRNSSSLSDREKIARVLPSEYANVSWGDVAITTVQGQRIAAVCSASSRSALARVFIVALDGRHRLLASTECSSDAACDNIGIFSDGRSSVLISLVTHGSGTNCHLSIYCYSINSGRLQQQVTTKCFNGRVMTLSARSGQLPAFLAAEPLYGASTSGPQRFSFRLYSADSSSCYKLKLTLKSNNKYNDVQEAYGEVRNQLISKVGSSFVISEVFASTCRR